MFFPQKIHESGGIYVTQQLRSYSTKAHTNTHTHTDERWAKVMHLYNIALLCIADAASFIERERIVRLHTIIALGIPIQVDLKALQIQYTISFNYKS